MNKKIILLVTSIMFIGICGTVIKNKYFIHNAKKEIKTSFKAIPEKYALEKDPRYLACVAGANNVVKKYNQGNEKMILITCKQIERMKIEDLKNSCLMGSIGILHFIGHKEFHQLKGQNAVDWANSLFCKVFDKKQ